MSPKFATHRARCSGGRRGPSGAKDSQAARRGWDSRDHPQFARAFTLIEVLVALAILALAAIVLGAAYANTLGAHRAVAQRAVGGSAMDFLRDQVLNEPEREKVEKGGDLSLPDDRRLRWEAKIEEAPVPDLFKVTIRTRLSGGMAQTDEENTDTLMLLRPTWSDAQRREQLRSDWRAAHEKAQEAKK